MSKVQITSLQIADNSIRRADINATVTGQATLLKVVAGTCITLTNQTMSDKGSVASPDVGTGDCKIDLNVATLKSSYLNSVYIQKVGDTMTGQFVAALCSSSAEYGVWIGSSANGVWGSLGIEGGQGYWSSAKQVDSAISDNLKFRGSAAAVVAQHTGTGLGCRAITFDRSHGISIYADTQNTTANTAFVPTRRLNISNDGTVCVDSKLSVAGTSLFSSLVEVYANFNNYGQFTSWCGAGVAPLVSSYSTAVCTNINADMLDGKHATDFATASHTHSDYFSISNGGTVSGDATFTGNVTLPATWNAKHSYVGSAHLWKDSNNYLRYKVSAPSSETDGITLYPPWKMLSFDAESMTVATESSFAPLYKLSGSIFSWMTRCFDPSTVYYADFGSVLPAGLDPSGNARIYVRWVAADATTGNVLWKIWGLPVANGSAWDDYPCNPVSVLSAAPGNTTSIVVSYVDVNVTTFITQYAGNKFGWFRFGRAAADSTDTYAGNAYLISVDIAFPRI
jgi:hypothetical protein